MRGMPRPSYKELEKQRREEEILTTAERLMAEHGYGNLNMDELAEVVGISKPTLYQHFKSKEDLAVQVFVRSFRTMEQFLETPLDGPAIKRIKTLMSRLLTMRYSPGSVTASIRPNMIWNMLRENPGLEAHRDRLRSLLRTLVDTAKAEGDIDPALPTSVVIHAILCLQGALRDQAMQVEITNNFAMLESGINSIIRLFLHGATPAP